MKILDRYIGRMVSSAVFTVMGVLVTVFSFFKFIDELDELGQGRYEFIQAAEFVGLSIPRLTYELFPVGALIGSLVGFGTLVSNSELVVIRGAGVSLGRIVIAVLKVGLLIMAVAVIIGEWIAPPMDQLAQHRRSVATTDQIALKTRNGFWARDGRNYVNIRKILPGDRVEEIYIYEFDKGNRLKASTYAKHAGYIEGQWLLEDLEQIIFKPNKISQQHIERARWGSLLNPKLIHLVVIKPNNLSIRDLYRYIHFLKINNQNRLQYEQALWFKITYPLATGVMVFLAIPIVLGTLNKATVGQRVVLGSCLGLVFHIFNKAAGQLGVVLDLNPALSVTFPTVLALLIALVLMRKVA